MRFKEFTEDLDAVMRQMLGVGPSGLDAFGSIIKKLQPSDKSTGTEKTEKPSTSTTTPAPAAGTTKDAKAPQDKDFNTKLRKIADTLGVKYEDLYKIIKTETAGTFKPDSKDPFGVSIGLIGFTRDTARSLGTSREELGKMTAVEQLDYVYKFYKKVGVKPGDDVGIISMKTFMPAFAYSPDGTVLGKKGGGTLMLPNGKSSGLSMHEVWKQNPLYGKSKGRDSFTVGDVKSFARSR